MAQGNQPQKRNLAAEAFKRSYTTLHDALAQPGVAGGLATKLYCGAIIALETRDAVQTPFFTPTQQANWLLQAVECSIKIDHTRLRKLTRVLRKQPVLVPIAKQLRQCYRELVSEAKLTESSSSGSDTDSTEQHQPQAPERLQSPPTSTLSPSVEEQDSGAIPLLQASQSSQPPISPHSISQPIPVPVQHRDRAHHEAFLSTPESQTIYPTSDQGEDPQVSFRDVTSQVETMIVQSPIRRSSEPAEEGARGSVSPKSPAGIKFTGTSPYEEWCCRLYKNDGGSQDAASGVIVKLNYSPEELHTCLPGLKPMKLYPKEYGSVETSYILITCHRVIPGMSYLKGWSLDVGLGKSRLKSPLKQLVCGAVSCCGDNGFISSGPLKPADSAVHVFSTHPKDDCLLDLDFTILFLNSAFEKLVKKGVQTEPPEINLNLKAERHQRLQLYQRERHKVVPIFLNVRVQQQDSSCSALEDEICAYKTLEVIHYIQSESKLTQCCSGSPLVSCGLNGDETLVGIHVKAGSDCDGSGSGVTINGIFQLLKGQLAAFFALMEKFHARRIQSVGWDHLLIQALDGLKKKPLSYLLEILHHLLTEKMGICVIELLVSNPSSKHQSVLEVLSALFKQFDKCDKCGCEEITKAVSGTFTEKTENQFNKEVKQVSDFLIHLPRFLLDTQNEVELVKAYFVCYNRVLNFEYGQIQAELSKEEVTKDLQNLRDKYSPRDKAQYVIERNFHDIGLQLMKCKYESKIHQLEEQLKMKCKYESKIHKLEEQLKEQKTIHEFQIQQLKAQLQTLQDEMSPGSYRRQSS